MSFSHDIKKEIIENRQARSRLKNALSYGLFLFGRRFDADAVQLVTENEDVSKLFISSAQSILGIGEGISVSSTVSGFGKTSRLCAVTGEGNIKKLFAHFKHKNSINRDIIKSPDDKNAFLAGAFLACGSVSDPQKSYHLEYVAKDAALCNELAELLDESIPGVKTISRRGMTVAYYKECSQIEDMLTLLGASRASLVMIDVEMIKHVRNRANRVTNCETANIDKLVGAASAQVEDINYIISQKGISFLPENLRDAAILRLENPELSLRELSELMPEPITRSGMYHRLEKLSKIAAELRLHSVL